MILVIDSGVWISALQFKGTPLMSIELALLRHRVAVCDTILNEVRAALVAKFSWTVSEVQEVFDFYLATAMNVRIRGDLKGICREPKDDMVFECAALAGATVIVAGDKDLLAVKSYKSIRILTPRQFLDEFTAAPSA